MIDRKHVKYQTCKSFHYALTLCYHTWGTITTFDSISNTQYKGTFTCFSASMTIQNPSTKIVILLKISLWCVFFLFARNTCLKFQSFPKMFFTWIRFLSTLHHYFWKTLYYRKRWQFHVYNFVHPSPVALSSAMLVLIYEPSLVLVA